MTDPSLLGGWVRRFLLEYLVGERNLARNTQQSYRDTLRLLLPFLARRAHKSVERLAVLDLSSERVREFLNWLEAERGCGVASRNQRLAALRSLAHFIGLYSPEHVEWAGHVRSVPFKKASQTPVGYLEKSEMDALLAVPDRTLARGRRDHALLLFLYNTGSRADEAAHVLVEDLHLPAAPGRDTGWVLLRGKGDKRRHCPLWANTVQELIPLAGDRAPSEHVFLNRRGQPLTRFGVHALVERCAAAAPLLRGKRVSPHTIRHTTAMHLLRAGVDINTIRAWLGHVSLRTTSVYAEADLEKKAKALANCEVEEAEATKSWKQDVGLMAFLNSL
jgi:site-specific recombinase XerD